MKFRFDSFLSTVFWINLAVAQFDLQFIGNYVTTSDASNRVFCDSKYCVLDANDLFYAATQNASVRPCEDFKEFALGTFIKYRALNDRDRYNGFLLDIQASHHERQRKVLSADINESKDIPLVKIMKKLFSQCVDSRYVNQNGPLEIREYLLSRGLSFYPHSEQPNFNLTKLFEEEPEDALIDFLRLKLVRCQHSHNKSLEVLCLRSTDRQKTELWFAGITNMLEIFRNSSDEEIYRKEFRDIAKKSYEFQKLQVT